MPSFVWSHSPPSGPLFRWVADSAFGVSAAVLLVLAGNAFAGPLSEVKYTLYYLSPGGPVQVSSADALPSGSNVAPNNQWRYEYSVLNKSPNPLNAFYPFFNSDNVNRAGKVSGTAPASWTITGQGPTSGNYNFKVRYLTTVAGAKIPPTARSHAPTRSAGSGRVCPARRTTTQ